MCRAHTTSPASSLWAEPPADVWWEYLINECRNRGVTPTSAFGTDKQLAPWLKHALRQTPPLRMRERAWMRLFAMPTVDEPLTVNCDRVPVTARRSAVPHLANNADRLARGAGG
jgi:hypothetical protein